MQVRVQCSSCGGSGRRGDDNCNNCGGSGTVWEWETQYRNCNRCSNGYNYEWQTVERTCIRCGGAGYEYQTCPHCGGSGDD